MRQDSGNKSNDSKRAYIAIDLKSFYASVECVERGLDPLDTNLLVADVGRTEKTICLAVTPSLKSYGISGRARLFEVTQRLRDVNLERKMRAPHGRLAGESCSARELRENPSLAVSYIAAPPRMGFYMEYSTKIYEIYLKYVSPEDIHVYSVDEVFIDATGYLGFYKKTARELAMTIIKDVFESTGITATAGVGTNLYLAKIAMDIVAKKMKPDRFGVRIAELDEASYRELLWEHKPLTSFWRVGEGYAKKLESRGIFTMGDIARCSVGSPFEYYNEELLYKLFGVNAELLIDHAWGYEPCTIADIKAYKPSAHSISSGQVLATPYTNEKARLIVREMTELLSLDLVGKRLATDQLVLTVGYDVENLLSPQIREAYRGEIVTDRYGRRLPKSAHGTVNLSGYSSSTRDISRAVDELFSRITEQGLLVRRVTIAANRVIPESSIPKNRENIQLDMFTDYALIEAREREVECERAKERKIQEAVIEIRRTMGKNAIVKGMNLEEGATTIERNSRIGGHRA